MKMLEDFFVLLNEWDKLCKDFNLVGTEGGKMDQHDMDSDESKIVDGLLVTYGQ